VVLGYVLSVIVFGDYWAGIHWRRAKRRDPLRRVPVLYRRAGRTRARHPRAQYPQFGLWLSSRRYRSVRAAWFFYDGSHSGVPAIWRQRDL